MESPTIDAAERLAVPSMLVPLAPLLAAAVVLAIIANFSFLGVAANLVALPAALAGLLTMTIFMTRGSWRELALSAIVFAIPFLHFLAPAIVRGGHLVLVDAGDFWSYATLGSWLMRYPITRQADFGADYTVIQFALFVHQIYYLRLGATFLLSFVALSTGREAVEVYTIYCAALVGLQSLSVYVFALVAFPQLRPWTSGAMAVIYGVSPVPVWAAAASFLPQTLGLAFVVGAVAVFIFGVRQAIQENWPGRRSGKAVVGILALLLFGAWSVYPEGVPVGFAICGFYSAFIGRYRLLDLAIWKRLVLAALPIIAIWLVLSPSLFVWGAKGLIVQLNAIPHGGRQLSTPFHLFGMMVLAAPAPLTPALLEQTGPALLTFGYVMWMLGIVGLVSAVLFGDRALGAAALATGLLLMAAVAFKYRFAAYGSYPDWPSLYSWNLFKAAQYLAPFLSTLALGGLLLGAHGLSGFWRLAAVSLAVLAPLGVALGQDLRFFWPRLYTGAIDPEFKSFLQRLPKDARLLIDFDPNKVQPYERHAAYTILRDGRFISTHDAQSPALFSPRFADRKASFLSAPISYVLSDRDSRFGDLPVLDRYKSYRLLDARGSSLTFTVEGPHGPPTRLVSNASGLTIVPRD